MFEQDLKRVIANTVCSMLKYFIAVLSFITTLSVNAQTGTPQTKKPTENHRNPASKTSMGINGDNGIVQSDTIKRKVRHDRNKKRGSSEQKTYNKRLRSDTIPGRDSATF